MGTDDGGASIGHTAADAATAVMFQDTWQIYSKMVENNFLHHREAYASLHDILATEVRTPFRFLDIACGDAGPSAGALRGTTVSHYRGIDFSAVALEAARQTVVELGIPTALEERDFRDALAGRTDVADVMWIGLSLHHLQHDEKRAYMRAVRSALHPEGMFLIYENTSRDGESREAWLKRFDAEGATWSYTADEWAAMRHHVHTSDFPENVADWHALGQAAGFTNTREIYRNPPDLFRLFAFSNS